MLVIRFAQVNAIVLGNRQLLVNDIESFIVDYCPDAAGAYPRPYLRWVIDDSIELALGMGIDDVYMLRVFVRLRWDIAPGFYKQPAIAALLRDSTLTPAQRFAKLATDDFADAWEEACRFDSPAEWRVRFWEDEP